MSEKDTSKPNTDDEQQLQKPVKSHDEIIRLISDIDQYEQGLEAEMALFPSFPGEIEEPITHQELTPETTEQEITEYDIPTGKTTLHLRWRKKAEREKTKRHFKHLFKRQPEQPKDKDSFKKRFYYSLTGSTEPISTFSLKLNEEGNLTGFNIKEPTLTFKEVAKSFFSKLKSRFAKKSEGESEEKTGIKGKLLGIVKRGKKSSEGESEKKGRFSGIGSKLKGVIPKRGKKEE